VRPAGPGWTHVRAAAGGAAPLDNLKEAFANWIMGIVLVYAVLFAARELLFGTAVGVVGYTAAGAIAGAVVARNLQKGPARPRTPSS
jgi:hypothetical protein